MVIGIFGLGLTLELLSQVMKRILVYLLFPIWEENLMDVFPLRRAIGFANMEVHWQLCKSWRAVCDLC